MVNVLLMATDINVIVKLDIPAANVKVSITSYDFFRNYQSKFLLHNYKKMICCLSFVLVLRIRTILKMWHLFIWREIHTCHFFKKKRTAVFQLSKIKHKKVIFTFSIGWSRLDTRFSNILCPMLPLSLYCPFCIDTLVLYIVMLYLVRINWWIVNKNKLYVLKHDKQIEERK